MILIVLSLIMIFMSGLSEGIMDTLQFHFSKSLFCHLKQKTFWDPQQSWKNKWKHGNPQLGERFKFSSTFFVFLTDAWHLFKFLRNTLLFIGIPLGVFYVDELNHLFLYVVVARATYGLGFIITYK